MSELETVSKVKIFEGWLNTYTHQSKPCNCKMIFSIYLPPKAENEKVPVLYWLSGLTSTNENFMMKAGALKYAAEQGIAIVTCDTSPRGAGIAGEDDSWDFGTGAGFYLNATKEPWSKYYNMYDYVLNELPQVIENNFNVNSIKSISGHSMGGHGAITIALKNPNNYRSVSAFSPICAPMQCDWGVKAFTNYLGENKKDWEQYDATQLILNGVSKMPILIDQGTKDSFLLENKLRPDLLLDAAKKMDFPINLRMREDYDHGYYFISSFIEEHINYHASFLNS
ncbi:MAG: S-formylglutathione hydrolase [Candidatus Sericytochromatia bacterium]